MSAFADDKLRDPASGFAGGGPRHPREAIEAALAHVVQNKVEAAHAQSDLFERWRLLMDDWASLSRGNPSSTPTTSGNGPSGAQGAD